MPSHVSIKSLSVDKGVVQITATTSTKSTVAKFITQLKGMPGITNVFVPSTSEAKDAYGVITTNFSVSFSFNKDIANYLEQLEEPEEGETVEEEVE
jgi:hypothetical protein